MGADGLVRAKRARLPADDVLLEAYRLMMLIRMFDEKAVSLQRQGRLGTVSTAYGQEAAIAGAVLALDPKRDWVVPQYRELPALSRHGFPLANAFCHHMGNPAGDAIPDGVKMLPVQIALAAQIPHAVGLAWGERLRGSGAVSLAFFGEGASSEGDFHEACNLAGVVKAPVILVLQNNGWAISTPRSLQSAAESFVARAAGYGIRGELVDGNDVVAVLDSVRRAVALAREGGGASLIEMVTYRLGAHNTADDASRYVPTDELTEALERDPLHRLRALLESRGVLDEERDGSIAEETKAEVAAALAEAEARPRAQLVDLLGYVYAKPPARLVAQMTLGRGAP